MAVDLECDINSLGDVLSAGDTHAYQIVDLSESVLIFVVYLSSIFLVDELDNSHWLGSHVTFFVFAEDGTDHEVFNNTLHAALVVNIAREIRFFFSVIALKELARVEDLTRNTLSYRESNNLGIVKGTETLHLLLCCLVIRVIFLGLFISVCLLSFLDLGVSARVSIYVFIVVCSIFLIWVIKSRSKVGISKE